VRRFCGRGGAIDRRVVVCYRHGLSGFYGRKFSVVISVSDDVIALPSFIG
jgi:hypothetical protein